MKHTNIIFFIGGAVVGALGGFFGAKTHYEKLFYDAETAKEMRELYAVPPAEEEYDEEVDDEINPVKTVNIDPQKIDDEIRKKLERNRRGTNYAAVYGYIKREEKGGNDDEREGPENVVGEDTENTEADDAEEPEIVRRYEENKGRRPHLISAEKAHDLPDGVDLVVLQFYDIDEVLTDGETEEPIYDTDRVVGDCLTKYGFVNSDEQVIYVMNEEFATCYEIIRVSASYEGTHFDE